MRSLNSAHAALASLALAFLAAPRSAAACGGMFCDNGPTAMPVDQTGENIIFVMDGQTVEAHIQIQYQGSAAKFAWVLPMQSLPAFSVGSSALFTNLLSASVPTYGFSTQRDSCQSNDQVVLRGAPSAGAGGAASYLDNSSGPSIVLRQTVGAFDIVVLQGGTAQEVSDWLNNNGYQSAVTAPSILQDYVSKGYVFVAVKLTGGAGVDEIHPLVVKYPGNTPCVPLKLTSVAAVPDMGVRTFFLGSERAVPTNYKHITLNSARINWLTFGSNYNQVVTNAADTPVSDGHGFVTEYAGPSSVVGTNGVYSTQWDSTKFQNIAPELVVSELQIQNLVQCFGTCTYSHPMVKPLLEEFLPRPAGITEDQFYSNLALYKSQIDMTAWNAAGFSQKFDERIVQPGLHAVEILGKNPYLTRLFTTISPSEMTLDPEFRHRADLPNVALTSPSNPTTQANQRILCDGRSLFTLPDGQQILLNGNTLYSGATWPDFSDTPWAATIEDIPATGDPVVLVDNRKRIQSDVDASNARNGWPGDEGACACSVPTSRPMSPLVPLALGAVGLWWGRRRARG
jgi:hypothetical protein